MSETETPKIRLLPEQLNLVVRTAYDLSQPQGMGYLHFTPAPMTEEEAQKIVDAPYNQRSLGMDYVNGRAVKLHIHKDADGYFLYDHGNWFDHSTEQWERLKQTVSQSATNEA